MGGQIGAAKIDIRNGKRNICLCSLPTELLLIILSYLFVLDYISIRAVCKCWRSAFLNFQSPISLNEEWKQLPWFLLLRSHDLQGGKFPNSETPALYTTGKLGDLSTQRIHTLDIPELCGTRFLLSRHCWLLLFSSRCPSSLFFFNPFSRARINLPFMDVSKLCNPVFDISAPPTSSECTVFVISCAGIRSFEISICRRGESAWTTKVYSSNNYGPGAVLNAFFVKGVFYCLHDVGSLSVVDAGNSEWREIDLITDISSCCPLISYVMKHDDEVRLYIHTVDWAEIVLKEPLKVNQGCVFWVGETEFMLRFSLREKFLQVQDQLKLSSFNIHAWCGTGDVQNGMTFHWHHHKGHVDSEIFPFDPCSSVDNRLRDVNAKICHPTYYSKVTHEKERDNCTIVAWFEPAWVHCSPDLDWTLGD